ncbi:MAG: hypothetical protein PHW60_12225 [Kiritimatiellae bacterium]|nr:hypothetical protein [Kiritimatiellia bacterium]
MAIDTSAPGFSTRLALFFSAAACPGVGHFVQRRWLCGSLFLVAFVICIVMTLLLVVMPLMTNLRIALDFAEKGSSEPFREIALFKVLAWFGLAIFIYVAALVDIIAYARRQARQRLGARQKNLELQ